MKRITEQSGQTDTVSPSPAEQVLQRIAFAEIVLPDGKCLNRQVVEFDSEGTPLRHYPLQVEEPFVEWRKTTYCWSSDAQAD